jgi:hypothetical protein
MDEESVERVAVKESVATIGGAGGCSQMEMHAARRRHASSKPE